MDSAIRFDCKMLRVAAVLALALSVVAGPAWAQDPITLAGNESAVAFPATAIGESVAVNATLNVNAPFTLAAVSTTGDFELTSTNCNPPVTLAAGDSCVLEISFRPIGPGPRWSPMILTDGGGKKYSFGLAGTGVGPTLTFSPGIVSTVAGNGTSGYSGDGGLATSAELNSPMGMARDSQGILYVADFGNNVIRKISADGTIRTVAGNGTQGYSGDGGPATSAQLAYPFAVALDAAGNLYIADFFNFCLRKVDANGTISTLASGFLVRGVAADSIGNIYYSSWPEGVWKVDSQGVSTRIAGNGTQGFSGDGGLATNAQTSGVGGLALDSQGNLYFAEMLNSDVRKVDTNGIITTVAGDHQFGFAGDGGPATSARFNGPTDIRIDAAGDFYIVDSSNNRIRKVNASGTISTIVGDGNFGYAGDGGLASQAQFAGPVWLTLDQAGNLFIADTGNNVIREVRVDSTTLDFGKVTVGQTGGPLSVTVSNAGNADLNISSVVASSDFAAQTTCSMTGLPAGSECSVDVSFLPTVEGNIVGTVTVRDDAPGNPHVINLKGQGYVVPVATQLVFGNSFPTRQLNGNLGTVTVNATDAKGNLATGFNGTVIVAIQGPVGFAPYSGQANAANGTAAFDLTAVMLNVAGSYTITANSSPLTPAQASFLVVGNPDFSVSMSAPSLKVTTQGSGSINATVTPINGFTGSIALNCSGLPSHTTCSFAPALLQANGSDTALVSVVTITTGVATVGVVRQIWDHADLLAASGICGIGLLGLVCVPFGRRRRDIQSKRARIAELILVAIILCIGLAGCGRLSEPPEKNTTPPGTYTITVTAASSGLSHSSTFNLIVQ